MPCSSGGRIWKQDLIERCTFDTLTHQSELEAQLEAAAPCKSETPGFYASTLCSRCSRLICENCRFRCKYSGIPEVGSQCYNSVYESEFEKVYKARLCLYCDSCELGFLAKLTANMHVKVNAGEGTEGRQCLCRSRMCVQCFKELSAQLRQQKQEGRRRSKFVCGNRRKVVGCLGASSYRTDDPYCGWCKVQTKAEPRGPFEEDESD